MSTAPSTQPDPSPACTPPAGREKARPKSKFKAQNEQDQCVACGVCAKMCPKDAISIHKGCYAVVDENCCVGCGICEKNCPAGVMHKVTR